MNNTDENEQDLDSFPGDLSSLEQNISKEDLLAFPFDHIYAMDSHGDMHLEKEVEIATNCEIGEVKEEVNQNQDIDHIKRTIHVCKQQIKHLKEMAVVQLDLIQQQNSQISTSKKSFQSLKHDNIAIKNRLRNAIHQQEQQDQAPPPLVSLPSTTMASQSLLSHQQPPRRVVLTEYTEIVIQNRPDTERYVLEPVVKKMKEAPRKPTTPASKPSFVEKKLDIQFVSGTTRYKRITDVNPAQNADTSGNSSGTRVTYSKFYSKNKQPRPNPTPPPVTNTTSVANDPYQISDADFRESPILKPDLHKTPRRLKTYSRANATITSGSLDSLLETSTSKDNNSAPIWRSSDPIKDDDFILKNLTFGDSASLPSLLTIDEFDDLFPETSYYKKENDLLLFNGTLLDDSNLLAVDSNLFGNALKTLSPSPQPHSMSIFNSTASVSKEKDDLNKLNNDLLLFDFPTIVEKEPPKKYFKNKSLTKEECTNSSLNKNANKNVKDDRGLVFDFSLNEELDWSIPSFKEFKKKSLAKEQEKHENSQLAFDFSTSDQFDQPKTFKEFKKESIAKDSFTKISPFANLTEKITLNAPKTDYSFKPVEATCTPSVPPKPKTRVGRIRSIYIPKTDEVRQRIAAAESKSGRSKSTTKKQTSKPNNKKLPARSRSIPAQPNKKMKVVYPLSYYNSLLPNINTPSTSTLKPKNKVTSTYIPKRNEVKNDPAFSFNSATDIDSVFLASTSNPIFNNIPTSTFIPNREERVKDYQKACTSSSLPNTSDQKKVSPPLKTAPTVSDPVKRKTEFKLEDHNYNLTDEKILAMQPKGRASSTYIPKTKNKNVTHTVTEGLLNSKNQARERRLQSLNVASTSTNKIVDSDLFAIPTKVAPPPKKAISNPCTYVIPNKLPLSKGNCEVQPVPGSQLQTQPPVQAIEPIKLPQVPGIVTKQAYHTSLGDPNDIWFYGLDTDIKTEDLYNNAAAQAQIEVPQWRVKVYDPTMTVPETREKEKVDDDTFKRRHIKHEANERRQLRQYMRHLREERTRERLQRRQNPSTSKEPPPRPELYTFQPRPQEIQYIEITNRIPVSAFGEPIPRLSPSYFSLHGQERRRKKKKKSEQKKARKRNTRAKTAQ